ncbi:hemolysin family protein [Stygiobacter electus]|uniref:Hemolysin family protein n=1 Tax=Stygiobacter electus TaxID=3032292 RepID=A0AAE3NZF5_9BACT|nr:hemolysin family protein [Stygiobacter electus]MDF1611450.1 hemolysin family protein [Stygiobacter electus]
MDISWSLDLIIIFICLFLSALFSASEIAIFSFDKKNLKEFKKDHLIIGKYLTELLNNSKKVLITILLSNTVVAVWASIVSVQLTLSLSEKYGYSKDAAIFTQIILLTILLLTVGEITPKIWANKYQKSALKIVIIPVYSFYILLYPISFLISILMNYLSKFISDKKSTTALIESEIKELADLSVEKGTIEADEHELINGIVSFKSVTAREIMTPRVDIAAVSVDSSFDELLNIINESGHSRIPLYEKDLDNIKGIIISKDLLPFIKDKEKAKNINLLKISREPIFVPSTKHINDLLHEFQEKKIHLAIVVDEYGGTAGLISLEDILEEIVGEIRDEHDKEENEILKISENCYQVLGKLSIDELNELLNENFSSENDDYDTIGGFVFNHAGKIPEKDYSFTFKNYKFTVKEILNNRINKVQIEKVES